MNTTEAAEVLAEIAMLTSGWDDVSADKWHERLSQLEHADIAHQAAQQLIDHRGDRRGRPEWAEFLTPYRTLLARRITEQPALPEAKTGWLKPSEYAARLAARVEAGLPSYRNASHTDAAMSAADEAANWRRIVHGDGSNDWHKVINSTEPEDDET